MATSTVEQDLLALERRYWQALKDKDVAGALELTDEPCLIAGAQGVARVDRSAYQSMMDNAAWEIVDFEIGGDVQVRVFGEDTAIVAYTVREELVVEGEPVTMSAADASTWVRRDGRWRCALHTESIRGDPIGRDRRR
jgi:uncharacterized protein (TIGR02246 family)